MQKKHDRELSKRSNLSKIARSRGGEGARSQKSKTRCVHALRSGPRIRLGLAPQKDLRFPKGRCTFSEEVFPKWTMWGRTTDAWEVRETMLEQIPLDIRPSGTNMNSSSTESYGECDGCGPGVDFGRSRPS